MQFSEPGGEDRNCLICDALMNVERNCYGPTSWAGSMAGIKKKHDRFTCPNSKEDWHIQLVDIKDLMRTVRASGALTSILQKEFADIKLSKRITNGK